MTVHDQLFKELLEARLGDFLEIVVPHIAAHLDLEKHRILPSETFTDRPRGEQRVLDLVAEVPDRHQAGSELVLVHVEIERDRRSSMAERMWDYSRALALREDRPILPLVLYLRGGPSKPTKKTLRRTIGGEEMAAFSYYAFGLSGSPAEEYVTRPQPLAWALAALMKPPEQWSAARHLLACFVPMRESQLPSLDDATRYLLLHCIETYIELDIDDQKELEMLSQRSNHPGLEDTKRTLVGRMKAEARLQERVRLLSQLIETRFGPLSASGRKELEDLAADDQAEDLVGRLLDAQSLEDLGGDRKESEMLRGRPGYSRLEDIKMTWADKQVLKGRVDTLARLLERRFGPLPESVRQSLESEKSPRKIDDLTDRLLDADSLEDLGLA